MVSKMTRAYLQGWPGNHCFIYDTLIPDFPG